MKMNLRIVFSLLLAFVTIPFGSRLWASEVLSAPDETGGGTTTAVTNDKPVYQDTNPDGENYLDRQHALVGPYCTINNLGGNLANVIDVTSGMENITDLDLTNYVKTASLAGVTVAVNPSFSVKDTHKTYAAGTTAGFVISMSSSNLLNLKLIGLPFQIWFYKDGKVVDHKNCKEKSGSLLNLNLLRVSGSDITSEITATSDKDFDEIAFCAADGVKLDLISGTKVFYAFVGKNGKYYLSREEPTADDPTPGLTGLKKEFSNENLNVARNGGLSDDLIDADPKNTTALAEGQVTVMVYDPTKTINDQFTFPAGCRAGFEYTAGIIEAINYLTLKLWKYSPEGKTGVYSGQWQKIELSNKGEFDLLNIDLGLSKKSNSVTAPEPFNAVEIVGGGLNTGFYLKHAFIELPPSYDTKPTLSVSADRGLCDENQSVDLHSDEAVSWTCTSVPEGANASDLTLTPSEDGKTCTVSGFKKAGQYVFTATTTDNRTATTKVTYGIAPIVDEGIKPWVNNFTEKNVTYSADMKPYEEKYKITSFSLIPSITTNEENLVTPSIDDYMSVGGISLANDKIIAGVWRSAQTTTTEKTIVGFITRTKWSALDLSLLNGYTVKLYNSGDPVTTVSSENVHFKVLSANLIGADKYVTTQYSVEVDANTQFDAITLWSKGALDLSASQTLIYYAFEEPSALADAYAKNVAATSELVSDETTGASIDASKLGHGGIATVASTVTNLYNVVDNDITTYATLAGVAKVGDVYTIPVKLGKVYDGGHQVQIYVSNLDWLKVNLATDIKLAAYRNGELKSQKNNWDVLSADVIGGENKQAELVWTPVGEDGKPVDFDEITIQFYGLANVAQVVNVYGIRISGDADGDGIPDASDDQSCDNPFLIDENETTPQKSHDFVNGRLNLRRYMNPVRKNGDKTEQWFNICLPVNLSFNQFVKAFGNEAELAKPADFDNDPRILRFTIPGNIYGEKTLLEAGVPYIIKITETSNLTDVDASLKEELEGNNEGIQGDNTNLVYKVQGVNFYMDGDWKTPQSIECKHPNNDTSVNPNVVWTGGYNKNQHIDADFWIFNQGMLTNISNAVDHIRGLRSWMREAGNGTAKGATFTGMDINGDLTGGISTGIHQINADGADNRMYNLQGMRVDKENGSLPAGIYIINHRKVIIK